MHGDWQQLRAAGINIVQQFHYLAGGFGNQQLPREDLELHVGRARALALPKFTVR